MLIKKGATDRSVEIKIIDSGDGTPENAVEHNTTGIDLWYRRDGGAKVSITEVALSALTDAHSDGGIELIGDGVYRLDLPDAAFATGANRVIWGGTVTGMIVIGGEALLVDFDPQDAVTLGLTALVQLPRPLWVGTLSAVANGTVTFPGGYGISTQAQILVEITEVGAHFGKSRYATYSGAGDVWNVDKAWNADGETTPTGTPTARAFSVPAEPATNMPHVDVRKVGGTAQTAGDLAALLTALSGRLPAALVSGRMDASVGAMAANVMTAAAAAADLTTELQSGLATAANLATVTGYLDTEIAAILTIAQRLDTALELDGAVYRFTLNALELAPTGGSAPSAAAIRAEIDANSTQLAGIRADTEDLQARTPAALVGGRMDVSVGAMAANVLTAAAAAPDLTTELQSGLATQSLLTTVAGYVDTEITAIAAAIAAQNNLSAAQVRAELAVELARLDATVSSRATPGAAMTLTSGERSSIVAALFAAVTEGTETFIQTFRIMRAGLAGKSSGHEAGTPAYRDAADTKNRITAVTTLSGDRTSVTTDGT
jgi:hypothetical protein